jgi:serine/threonine-protein kinase
VCKKYSPIYESYREELFKSFLREIKLLHEVYHQNVVRIFNYHIYPEKLAGYIVMEYVDGKEIDEYLQENPEKIEDIFLQTIKGFAHLESKMILHRDIRSRNLMVRNDGVVKIIDLGFGKRVETPRDFDKSVSLNWWCELPKEFTNSIYDFRTEIYFIGKLFEKFLQELNIDNFKYSAVLRKMCQTDPTNRTESFFDVEKEILANRISEIEFWGQELSSYRNFANSVSHHVTKIENGTKYFDDQYKIISKLESNYRSFMLEEITPDAATVMRCFINGSFIYNKKGLEVKTVRDFISLLKSSDEEKQRIILANIHSRLDAIDRYTKPSHFDDEIPF